LEGSDSQRIQGGGQEASEHINKSDGEKRDCVRLTGSGDLKRGETENKRTGWTRRGSGGQRHAGTCGNELHVRYREHLVST